MLEMNTATSNKSLLIVLDHTFDVISKTMTPIDNISFTILVVTPREAMSLHLFLVTFFNFGKLIFLGQPLL